MKSRTIVTAIFIANIHSYIMTEYITSPMLRIVQMPKQIYLIIPSPSNVDEQSIKDVYFTIISTDIITFIPKDKFVCQRRSPEAIFTAMGITLISIFYS